MVGDQVRQRGKMESNNLICDLSIMSTQDESDGHGECV